MHSHYHDQVDQAINTFSWPHRHSIAEGTESVIRSNLFIPFNYYFTSEQHAFGTL
jgi:hypothetical protein